MLLKIKFILLSVKRKLIKQNLLEIEIFCSIINAFTVAFDHLNAASVKVFF